MTSGGPYWTGTATGGGHRPDVPSWTAPTGQRVVTGAWRPPHHLHQPPPARQWLPQPPPSGVHPSSSSPLPWPPFPGVQPLPESSSWLPANRLWTSPLFGGGALHQWNGGDYTTGLVVESSTSPVECFTTVVVETTAGESVLFVFIFFFSIARPAVDLTTAAVMEHSINGMVVNFTTGLVVLHQSCGVLYHNSGRVHRVNSLLSSFCSNKPHSFNYMAQIFQHKFYAFW